MGKVNTGVFGSILTGQPHEGNLEKMYTFITKIINISITNLFKTVKDTNST